MAKFTDYKVNTGRYNMLADSEILDEAVRNREKEPYLRFYGWSPPCVSLGRNQSLEHINVDYCNENNIDIVRRITGGRGLLHDDEVTYSFVCPVEFLGTGESIIASYKEISSALISGFKNINIDLEFGGTKKVKTSYDYCMLLSTGADLTCNNAKLIGSAQYRKQGYILQHGSVLFSCNEQRIKNIFNEEIPLNALARINEINGSLTRYDVINAMKQGFKDYFSLTF